MAPLKNVLITVLLIDLISSS